MMRFSVKRLFNKLGVLLLQAVSHLPFFILYFLSDIFYIFINKVFKYRKKVIVTNLKNSFPEKSEAEIKDITRKFYRHFCDIFVESLKGYSISKEKLLKRFEYKSLDLFERYYNEGRSVILVGMHFNNWEWCSVMPELVKHRIYGVYSPIRGNEAFNNYLRKSRSRFKGNLIPMDKSARLAVDFAKSEIPQAIWLLADQSPPPNTKSWIMFLNQETGFFSGPEKIAFRSRQPLVFEHVKKVGRGRYNVFHYPLIEDYEGIESGDILIAFTRKMEELIREDPQYYLWSHRRWKRKRPEDIPLIET